MTDATNCNANKCHWNCYIIYGEFKDQGVCIRPIIYHDEKGQCISFESRHADELKPLTEFEEITK